MSCSVVAKVPFWQHSSTLAGSFGSALNHLGRVAVVGFKLVSEDVDVVIFHDSLGDVVAFVILKFMPAAGHADFQPALIILVKRRQFVVGDVHFLPRKPLNLGKRIL